MTPDDREDYKDPIQFQNFIRVFGLSCSLPTRDIEEENKAPVILREKRYQCPDFSFHPNKLRLGL